MGRQDQRGAVAVWTAVGIVAFIMVLGLGVDFAGHAAAEGRARAIAGEAARAAGQQVNIDESGVELNLPAAQRAAHDYLAASEFSGSASLDNGDVHINVEGTYHCQFLSIIGINSLPVSASASARGATVINGEIQ